MLKHLKPYLRVHKHNIRKKYSPLSLFFYDIPMHRDVEYPAQMNPLAVRDLIYLYSEEGETVLDPFMGSGTVLYEARSQGRNAIGFDVYQTALEAAKQRLSQQLLQENGVKVELKLGDARRLDLPDDSIHLIVTSPPYGKADLIKYGDSNLDISNRATDTEFLADLKIAMGEMLRVLKPDRLAVFFTQDRMKGYYWPLHAYLNNIAEEVGFEPWTFGARLFWMEAWTMHPIGPPDKRRFLPALEWISVFRKGQEA